MSDRDGGSRRSCLLADTPELVPSNSPITDDNEHAHVLSRIAALSGRREGVFPGSNPVSIERSMLHLLRRKPFYAGLKTDGIRFLLLLTMWKGEHRGIMINRALAAFEVEIWGNESFFEQEVLLDGELCWEHSDGGLRLLYLVFDAIHIRSPFRHLAYNERLSRVHKYVLGALPPGIDSNAMDQIIMDEDRIFMASANGRMMPKGFVDMSRVQHLWEQRGNSSHNNDGIIMVADVPLTGGGTDWWTLKWKPASCISIDLLYRTDAPGGAYATDGGQEVCFDRIDVDGERFAVTLERNQLLQYMDNSGGSMAVLECICEVAPGHVQLYPVRERRDKPRPNNLSTIRATIRNVIENILVPELAVETAPASDSTDTCRCSAGQCGPTTTTTSEAAARPPRPNGGGDDPGRLHTLPDGGQGEGDGTRDDGEKDDGDRGGGEEEEGRRRTRRKRAVAAVAAAGAGESDTAAAAAADHALLLRERDRARERAAERARERHHRPDEKRRRSSRLRQSQAPQAE